MAYIVADDELGFVDLYGVDTVGPGPLKLGPGTVSYGRFNIPGAVMRGVDMALGGGEFVFAQAAGTIAAGGVCEMTQTVASGIYQISAQAWAGTVQTGKPLCVALVALTAGQWGWFQVQGIAVVNCSGTPAAGNPVSWQASGVVSPTVVAGKSVLNAQFASANGVTYGAGTTATVLPSTQALAILNRPSAQGPIT